MKRVCGDINEPQALKVIETMLERIRGTQIKAARALLGWKQQDLCANSGVSLPRIKGIETTTGRAGVNKVTKNAIVRAFESAGVEFLDEDDGYGVLRHKIVQEGDAQALTPPRQGRGLAGVLGWQLSVVSNGGRGRD